MGATPLYGWPWPAYTDAADGSGVVKALALAMDTTVKALRDFAFTPARGRDMRLAITTRRSTTQSLPHNTTTGVVMDTTEHNTWGVNPRPEGWFLTAARVSYTGNASGFRQVLYRRNGSTSNLPASSNIARPTANQARTPNQETAIYLVPSDAVEVAAWQNCGVGLSTITNEDLCPRLMILHIYGPRPT